MSTGMRQKTALAAVLGYDTPLVILDEPTASLDPTARSEVLSLVREARDEGRTVLFSSHVLSEVEEVCDRVAVLRFGELVHEQSLHELRRQHRLRLRLRGPLPTPPAQYELTCRTPSRVSCNLTRRRSLRRCWVGWRRCRWRTSASSRCVCKRCTNDFIPGQVR